MTATNKIYTAAGVVGSGAASGTCRTCGETGTGDEFAKWVKDTFTDWDKLQAGDIVCNACLFCFDEQSEILRDRTGKEKLQRMRNYSHFVRDGEWLTFSKAEKTKIYECLLSLPAVAVVAESGQRHLIFKTRPGWWNYEGVNIPPFPEKLKFLYESAFRLYDLNIVKTEIESGRYSQRTFLQNGIETILELDEPLKPFRGSIELKLAIYLMQKEKEDESIV